VRSVVLFYITFTTRETATKKLRKYLRKKEQAAELRISVRTLEEWQQAKMVPFFKIGRIVLFDPEAVDKALRRFERKELVGK